MFGKKMLKLPVNLKHFSRKKNKYCLQLTFYYRNKCRRLAEKFLLTLARLAFNLLQTSIINLVNLR